MYKMKNNNNNKEEKDTMLPFTLLDNVSVGLIHVPPFLFRPNPHNKLI